MKKRNGFSLVELIVVIIILGVVSAVAISGVYKYIVRARQSTDINNCKALEDALNTGLNGVRFPAGDEYYSCVIIMDTKNDNGNFFQNLYLCMMESTYNGSTTCDKSEYTLKSGNTVYHDDIKDKVVSCLKNEKFYFTNSWGNKAFLYKVFSSSKTNNRICCILSIDKSGYFMGARCVLVNNPEEYPQIEFYKAMTGGYFSDPYVIKQEYKNLYVNWKKRVIWDGGQINKFGGN